MVYALVEAQGDAGGFFRSVNGGASWQKRSGYMASVSPQYYQELFACPHVFDRVYSMDVHFQVSEDGGRTWQRLSQRTKHVDNHALAFDPARIPTTCSPAATAGSTRPTTGGAPGSTWPTCP